MNQTTNPNLLITCWIHESCQKLTILIATLQVADDADWEYVVRQQLDEMNPKDKICDIETTDSTLISLAYN
jgi:hypothetical protein